MLKALAPPSDTAVRVDRIWAELTGKCQLACTHCYADSGPAGSHGKMTADNWMHVVDDAHALGAALVQFIGGEPTMHPGFTEIVRHAVDTGIDVEVYSNLVHITGEMWDLFTAPNISLAFSYYAKDPQPHNELTGRNSHAATRRNAAEAVRLGIPIRAGIIDVGGEHAELAKQDLATLGITRVTTDRIRAVGRGGTVNDPSELCGRCGHGVAAISPDGDVWPCIFSRWLPVGNVLADRLADILIGSAMAGAVAAIPPGRANACDPNTECNPGSPPTHCGPRS